MKISLTMTSANEADFYFFPELRKENQLLRKMITKMYANVIILKKSSGESEFYFFPSIPLERWCYNAVYLLVLSTQEEGTL